MRVKMATMGYNELEDARGKNELASNVNKLDPLYKYDTHFPERITKSTIQKETNSPRTKRGRCRAARNSGRFRTQPITFDEIKEVDEDTVNEETKENMKNQFTAFSKSLDGLVSEQSGKVQEKTESDDGKEDRLSASVLTESNAQNAKRQGVPAGLPMEYDKRRQKKYARRRILLEEPESDAADKAKPT